MPRLFSSRFWFPALAGLLLAGCRGGQAMFRFHLGQPAADVTPASRTDSSTAWGTVHRCLAAPGADRLGRPAARLSHQRQAAYAKAATSRPARQGPVATLVRRQLRKAAVRPAQQTITPAEHEFDFSTAFVVLFLLALGFGATGLLTLLAAALVMSTTTLYVGLALVGLATVLLLLALLVGN